MRYGEYIASYDELRVWFVHSWRVDSSEHPSQSLNGPSNGQRTGPQEPGAHALGSQMAGSDIAGSQSGSLEPRAELSGRHRAYLRAVLHGRAEMTCSCEPDLYVDGLPCCDQTAAHQLAEARLISPEHPGKPGERVKATLTPQGTDALEES